MKKNIGFIKLEKGLLLLEDQANLCLTSVHETTSSREKLYLAHRWMGHPSFVLMKEYFPTMFSDIDVNTLSCESCQLAKHKRSPFKALNIRCLRSFDCVPFQVLVKISGSYYLWMTIVVLHGCISLSQRQIFQPLVFNDVR